MGIEKPNSVKNRIVSTAWKLFYEKGYNETTVDEIIEQSDTSKGSFYYYFKTKDELLHSLAEVLDEFYEELDASIPYEQNSYEKLLILNYEAHKLIEEKINMDILASMYSTQLVSTGDKCLLDESRTYFKLISRIIKNGQADGELTTDLSVEEIAHYYAMCERALVSDWCLSRGKVSLAEISKKYMPIMLASIKK